MSINKRVGISLVLAAFLALNMTGCGSSNSTSKTDVVVERGKVYDANVTDSSTPVQIAQEKSGQNVYTFAKAPTFPIIVNAGWIDVNNDGAKDAGDVKLNIVMKSYSTVVTPITTFIANANKTAREQKLNELRNRLNDSGVGKDTNITVADLLKVPSEAPRDVFVLSNAIYKDMKENNNSLPTIDAALSQFGTLDSSLENNATAQDAEKNVMLTLENEGLIEVIAIPSISLSHGGEGTPSYIRFMIYENINNNYVNMLKQRNPADATVIDINCTALGFHGNPTVKSSDEINTYTYSNNYSDYTNICMEEDHSGSNYDSGLSTVLVSYSNP